MEINNDTKRRIDFVYKNVGKFEFEFEEVSDEKYYEFVTNYPNCLEHNTFMDWCDCYDFSKYKECNNINKFKVARLCAQYGITYYLPKYE